MFNLVKLVRTSEKAVLPTKGTDKAAGFDLSCIESFTLEPGERKLVQTGWKISIQNGFEGQVRPRSGLANKQGITVLNSPGTIDCDYTGPLGVILVNLGDKKVSFEEGDRVAQLVVARALDCVVQEVDTFEVTTSRGEKGFGSTGV